MNNLTNTELSVMNNITRVLNPNVSLGNRIQEIIGYLGKEGTPTNASSASAILSISGVVVDGERVTIGNDVYEFVADAVKTVSDRNIPVDISSDTIASHGSLTMSIQPTSGDTITIGDKTYIFVPVGTDTADAEVSIGASLSDAQANLVAAINGTDGISNPHPLVSASNFSSDICTITALIGGTAGDAIATTETFTSSSNVFGAATLGSGADCSAGDAVTALVTAITAFDTQGITGTDGTGDTVVLTASPGKAGNNISVSTTMVNASFGNGVTAMSGGTDGTVSSGVQFMVDTDYLYVCIGDNTASGQNWRKITLSTL